MNSDLQASFLPGQTDRGFQGRGLNHGYVHPRARPHRAATAGADLNQAIQRSRPRLPLAVDGGNVDTICACRHHAIQLGRYGDPSQLPAAVMGQTLALRAAPGDSPTVARPGLSGTVGRAAQIEHGIGYALRLG